MFPHYTETSWMIHSLIREICMNNELIEVKLLGLCFVIYLSLAFISFFVFAPSNIFVPAGWF